MNQEYVDTAIPEEIFEVENPEIKAGDWYFGRRNGPGQVLRCKEVDGTWVVPLVLAYPYSVSECRKLKPDLSPAIVSELLSLKNVEYAAWVNSTSKRKPV